jgi:hypothetical protein
MVTTDGPEFLNITFGGKNLTCSAEGNPSPTYHWIEVHEGNKVQDGYKLDLCDAFRTLRSYSAEQTVTFQCVAKRGSHSRHLSHSIDVNELKSICPSTGTLASLALPAMRPMTGSSH